MVYCALWILFSNAWASSQASAVLGAVWAGLLIMSPVGLQQAWGVTSDVVVFAFCLSFASLLLSGRVWRVRDWVFFGLIGLCAVQTKPVIAPLLLVLFWMPGSVRLLWQRAVVFGLFAYGLAEGVFSKASAASAPHADALAQKAHLLEHPVLSILMFLKVTFLRVVPYTQWLFGRLGWLDHKTNHGILAAYFVLLIALFVFARRTCRNLKFARRPWRHFLFFVLWIGAAALIELFIYLVWNPPGSPMISGLQGRYFLPLHLIAVGYLFSSLGEGDGGALREVEPQLFHGLKKVFYFHALVIIGIVSDVYLFYG